MEMPNDQRAVPDGATQASPSSNSIVAGQVNSSGAVVIVPPATAPPASINSGTGIAPTQTSGSGGSVKSLLNTADLVKILEMTLAEIRATQTLGFSLLGFGVAVG